mmetsp:Transcript_19652/g.45309  ORF Transcript_19652/g.45309 Transcript_19652/m.45309 type:complete len:102 (-) Transcript_19652:282-587(-)
METPMTQVSHDVDVHLEMQSREAQRTQWKLLLPKAEALLTCRPQHHGTASKRLLGGQLKAQASENATKAIPRSSDANHMYFSFCFCTTFLPTTTPTRRPKT